MFSVYADFKRQISQKKALLKGFACLIAIVIAAYTALPFFNTVAAAASSSKRKLPIYSVATESKKVAVSFDAAWGADDTDTILEILKKHNVKATFFLCGYWVDKYPDEVKRIFDAGHDIGNHGNTHAHGAKLGLEQNKQEILGVHEKIKNLLGIEMNLFRPPYGEYNNTVIDAAESLKYYTIQWDVDTNKNG